MELYSKGFHLIQPLFYEYKFCNKHFTIFANINQLNTVEIAIIYKLFFQLNISILVEVKNINFLFSYRITKSL